MDGRKLVKAFAEFKKTCPNTFKGSATGQYLRNRLEHAFQAGVMASESSHAELKGLGQTVKAIEASRK